MELNFEERVATLESLLEQRQEDLSALRREKSLLEAESCEELKLQLQLTSKLSAASFEKARLVSEIAQGQVALRDEDERLRSALVDLRREEDLAYKKYCSVLEISTLIDQEKRRTGKRRATLFASLDPILNEAERKRRDLSEMEERVAAAERALESEKAELLRVEESLEGRNRTLESMKANFAEQRAAITATRSEIQESGALMARESKRARQELATLRREFSDLVLAERDQGERLRRAQMHRAGLQNQLQSAL